jgi:hypothetical protein
MYITLWHWFIKVHKILYKLLNYTNAKRLDKWLLSYDKASKMRYLKTGHFPKTWLNIWSSIFPTWLNLKGLRLGGNLGMYVFWTT